MKRLKITLTAKVDSIDKATACDNLARQLHRTARVLRSNPGRPYFPLESDQPVRELEISFSEIPETTVVRGQHDDGK